MTSQQADDAEGPGAVRYRAVAPVGPPVDPYADGDGDAEPTDPYVEPYDPDVPEERYGQEGQDHGDPGEAHAVVGSVHPAVLPHTEVERNKEYRRQQDTQSPPKPTPETIGRYQWQQPPYTLPTDPVRQYVSGPKPRKRRSDWPVLVFAMVVAAVVTMGCCLAGFGLFATWNPFR